LTSHTADDGFHEIQLNGKQLVFLFMAATVVSVVIFLCGVLVGRGVRAERASDIDTAALDGAAFDQTTATVGDTPAGVDPRVAAPPAAAVDDLTYFNRLEKTQPIVEEGKPTAVRPASPAPEPAQTPVPQPVVAKNATPAAAPPAASVPAAEPASRTGFVVQVAALNSRGEADAMAKKLIAKGYQAYVQDPAKGGPSIFRVRVGSYPSRRDADTVAARLEKEGPFKPWVAPR
jgi:cell division septation protein DedD